MNIDTESNYSPFLVNRALSNFVDTIFQANEVNRLHKLTNRMQYDYLRSSIRKGKRFSPWHKPKKDYQTQVVMEYYKCNVERGKEIVRLLTDIQIQELEERMQVGGIRK